jgi:hypothetical protein
MTQIDPLNPGSRAVAPDGDTHEFRLKGRRS